MAIRLRFPLSCGTFGDTHESSRAGYAFNETVPDVSAYLREKHKRPDKAGAPAIQVGLPCLTAGSAKGAA
jgi:hypothetical protein